MIWRGRAAGLSRRDKAQTVGLFGLIVIQFLFGEIGSSGSVGAAVIGRPAWARPARVASCPWTYKRRGHRTPALIELIKRREKKLLLLLGGLLLGWLLSSLLLCGHDDLPPSRYSGPDESFWRVPDALL